MAKKTKATQQEIKFPVLRLPMLEIEEEVELRVRVSKKTAAAVAAVTPAEIVNALQSEAHLLMADLCTRWSNDKPPCQGWWDVTDNKTGVLNARWWFGGVWWAMGSDPYNEATTRIHWETFGRTYAWRGLLKMPETYPAPPYTPAMLPAGARVIVQNRQRIKWC